ncbi:unnamed protein product [Adineta ricciae]|uniref:Uncharacterized protein n=1 Tax=Adineta ricciae TaxID=249248 RepID=A0A813S0S2_ADIRI|nr:unnamed protein product [Adineta ricciae]
MVEFVKETERCFNHMALFDETQSRSGSRFGQLSSNMFFARNTANPKRVRHIEGLNGALICNVNDDPALIRSASTSSLSFNRANLPTLDSSRRVERVVPPMGFWHTQGIVHDTDNWKRELASLASASGLGLEKDDRKHHAKQTATANSQHASRSGAHYSTRTGRFNEGTAKSRGRTGSKHSTAYSDMLFHVPENEREMWMLQVLCQLLGTSNLEDVQSWLISATPTEKEQARTMINSALRGLKESERISNNSQQPVDLDSLTNFVEKQKKEEKQASKKYIKDTLNRSLQPIHEESQDDALIASALKKQSTLPLVNATTYQLSYPNYSQSPRESLEAITSQNRNDFSNDLQHKDDHEEQIETIHLDEDSPRPQTPSQNDMKKASKTAPVGRTPPHFDSIQINDDDYDRADNRRKETNYLSMNEDDDDAKARRIRDLQNKLTRQEEESKKQIEELQTKQSRLENALKLIVKQTSYGKRSQQTNDDNNNNKTSDGSISNVDSQKENERRQDNNSQKSSTMSKTKDDNRSAKSYAGVWKPDAAVLHRLQGN